MQVISSGNGSRVDTLSQFKIQNAIADLYPVDDFHSRTHSREDSVASVKMRCRQVGDEELTTFGVFSRTRNTYGTALKIDDGPF
jgi:hypothetical protein